MKFTPPNVAAYWSCRPPPGQVDPLDLERQVRDVVGPNGAAYNSRNASTSATTNAEDEPSPDPGGASTKE